MFYQNASQVKAYARTLMKSLNAKGFEVSLGKALDIVATTRGYPDWNAYSATLSESSVNSMLADHERSHAQGAGLPEDSGYDVECILQVHTGFTLRTPAYPENCDYVRVCDPLGREVSFWNTQELQESPEEVMGAVVGALVRGQSLTKKGLERKRKGSGTFARVPSIQDVDFNKVHAVIFGGQCFSIGWRELDVLAKVGVPASRASQDTLDLDPRALLVTFEEDGLVFEDTISLSKLNELTWDTKLRTFVDKDGDTYSFVIEESFADHFERNTSWGVKKEEASTASRATVTEDEYRLYTHWSDLEKKTNLFVGTSAANAVANSGAAVAAEDLNEMDSELYGPFIVEIGSGFYNEFPTLTRAVEVAKGLLAADSNADQASVLSKLGTRLITFEGNAL
jgi:hypothetical protein